jgi:hypothetical protein
VLQSFGDRLWLPYQVGADYHRNRLKALPQPRQSLERILKTIADNRERVDGIGFPDQHPSLDLAEAERRRQAVVVALEHLESHVKGGLANLPENPDQFDATDGVRDRLQQLFANRIGSPFAPADLDKLKKEADSRFAKRLPPGYKDNEKESDSKYGDYLIWRSLLNELKSRATFTGLIFVTNDRKEDWWLRRESQMIGPRPELIRECLDETGRLLFLYTPSDFLKASQQRLQVQVSAATVATAERVSQQSPIRSVLRILRMVLPDTTSRVAILRGIYDAVAGGQVADANGLSTAIERSQVDGATNYVSTPLFFSLINEAYGPLQVDDSVDRRLRERPVRLRESVPDAATFIRVGHVAWLAQALYRLRRSRFGRQDLADEFFGIDAGSEALQLVEEAEHAMEKDVLLRGQ